MGKTVFCTIFTPAYNRKERLTQLYDSLLMQTDFDFEWVIVDDGSTDGTDLTVGTFDTDKFTIKYKKTENGGKHRAINNGLEMACGEVFAIVDSDDTLTANAVEKIKSYFNSIENESKKFAGVAGLKGYSQNEEVGTSFSEEYVDAMSTQRKKYNINGDKFEIFYTDVLKKYKFPEFENEKFLTEALVWYRISYDGYYIRWFNEIIYMCEYLDGGLTDNRDKLIRQSPKGYALFIRECVDHKILSLKEKMGYYSYYYTVCKADRTLKEIAKELQSTEIIIYVAYVIRKIIELIRKGN